MKPKNYRNRNVSISIFEADENNRKPNVCVQRSYKTKRDIPEKTVTIPAKKKGEYVNNDLWLYENEVENLSICLKAYKDGKTTTEQKTI